MNINVLRSMRVGGQTALGTRHHSVGWGEGAEYQSVVQLDRSNQENHVGVRTLVFCSAPHPHTLHLFMFIL